MEATTQTACTASSTPHIEDGALQALKLLALLLMAVDHINAIVFAFRVPAMFDLGRLVFPLFAFVFGINLARPTVTEETLRRIIKRLCVYGGLAMPAYVYAHGWWPCNVLFTFALVAYLVLCWRRRDEWHVAIGIATFIVAGSVVEFWWFGVSFCLACYWWSRERSWKAVLGIVLTCSSLLFVNANSWALAALPLIALVATRPLRVPRMGKLFYWFYPAHLTALVAIAWVLHVNAH